MKVFQGRMTGAVSEKRNSTFTGEVWGDPIMPTTDGVTINHVFFTPSGRTHWHTHETGQVLYVTSGKGWICLDGEVPQAIRMGDVVWIGPNERHWHGAAEDSFMSHMAISVGHTNWQDQVTDDQYKK